MAEPLKPPHIIVEAGTGEVLEALEPTYPWYPASLTKMMTAYLAFEELEAGTLHPETAVRVSASAASQPNVRLGLHRDQLITIDTLLQSIIVVSANDAAVALAEAVADSEATFVDLMNAKARALGMTGTVFANATGLPSPGQQTNARDMALLAQRLLHDFPDQYARFGTTTLAFAGRVRRNTNPLLGEQAGVDGMKTGFTCAAGYNLAVSAERDGERIIAVVLGARSSAARKRFAARLVDIGFAALDRHQRAKLQGAPAIPMIALEATAASPVERLNPSECVRSQPRTVTGEWSLHLGIYTDRAVAKTAVDRAFNVTGAGRKRVQPREVGAARTWVALVTDLNRDAAGRACLRLRSNDSVCLVRRTIDVVAPGG